MIGTEIGVRTPVVKPSIYPGSIFGGLYQNVGLTMGRYWHIIRFDNPL